MSYLYLQHPVTRRALHIRDPEAIQVLKRYVQTYQAYQDGVTSQTAGGRLSYRDTDYVSYDDQHGKPPIKLTNSANSASMIAQDIQH